MANNTEKNMSYKNRDRRLDEVPNTNDPKLLSCRIYIGNIPNEKVSRQDIEEKFSKYGKVMGISMHRGFAFLQFEYEGDAQEAARQENGGLYKGNKIEVNITTTRRRDKDDKSSRPSGRRRSPIFDERRRDFRDRSPHREGNSDDRLKRDTPRFMREERFRDERPREHFYDGIRRRFEENPVDRRFEHRDEAFKFRRENFVEQHREMYTKEHFPDPHELRYPNDCEIIVPNKMQRAYAEDVEMRLKNLGLRVDLLFPHDETPIPQVLDDISHRGCLYAVVVLLQNEQHKSATINILWGNPQEHRNMPLEDAMNLIARSFETYMQTVRDKTPAAPPIRDRKDLVVAQLPPPAEGSIQALLNLLADGRPLSVPELDKIIRHLQERRDRLLQDTAPGDHSQMASLTVQPPAAIPNQTPVIPDQQAELQKRILSILNHTSPPNESTNQDTHLTNWNSGIQQQQPPQQQPQASSNPATVINFDNPNVQKALDNLIQSGPSLLRSLQATTVSKPTGTSNANQPAAPAQQVHKFLQQVPHQSLSNVSSVGMRNPPIMNQQRHPLLGTPTGPSPGMMMGRNSMMGRF